jgi:hypothetical protein
MIYHQSKVLLILAFVTAIAVGCGKKDSPAAATPPPTTPAAAPVAAAPAAPVQPVVIQNVNQSLTEVDSAVQAKNYEKAVQTMLAIQRQQALTSEQAQAAAARMRGLQSSLAAAVAAGDPAARAAADQLRHNHQ